MNRLMLLGLERMRARLLAHRRWIWSENVTEPGPVDGLRLKRCQADKDLLGSTKKLTCDKSVRHKGKHSARHQGHTYWWTDGDTFAKHINMRKP